MSDIWDKIVKVNPTTINIIKNDFINFPTVIWIRQSKDF